MEDIEARFQVDWPGFSLDVDLRMPGRGVTALFGHSGSGKTTLLRCIAGLDRTRRGFLRVNGEIWQDGNVWLSPHRRSIGYVFQDASLFPHLSVLGNVRYGLRWAGKKNSARVEQAIKLLGIEHLLDRYPERLSGGEKSRVAIARALAVNPRLLLMDEPLAALDFRRKQEILPYLERVIGELDAPMIYVSHSPDEVARLADHLIVMDGGKAVAQGKLANVLTQLDLPGRLGEDAGSVVEAIISVVDHQWNLARADFAGGSLWTRDCGFPVGRRVRVRVLARDVSLSTEHPAESSIQNCLRGTIDAIGQDEHPGLALARVLIGNQIILARLTRRSAEALKLAPGREVWVQVKSVALIE